ncbi:MAG: DsbA family protein [Chloroflexota bacterium]
MSKQKTYRELRRQKQRQKRITIILIVSGIALILVALLIYPTLKPVTDFVKITPVERPMENGRAMGDPNAPVTIEIFEDFQCSACQYFSQQIEPLITENYVATGKVYYIYRHYPFMDDRVAIKESDQAALASMCAADQGEFWNYHDILFANWIGANQGAFTEKRLEAFAQSLGLDIDEFNNCLRNKLHQDEIDEDIAKGIQLGVQGTPSVFVNGQLLMPGYVPSFEDIQQAVEAALASIPTE